MQIPIKIPEWATYITVDSEGIMYCFEYLPYKLEDGCWYSDEGEFASLNINEYFSVSDSGYADEGYDDDYCR